MFPYIMLTESVNGIDITFVFAFNVLGSIELIGIHDIFPYRFYNSRLK